MTTITSQMSIFKNRVAELNKKSSKELLSKDPNHWPGGNLLAFNHVLRKGFYNYDRVFKECFDAASDFETNIGGHWCTPRIKSYVDFLGLSEYRAALFEYVGPIEQAFVNYDKTDPCMAQFKRLVKLYSALVEDELMCRKLQAINPTYFDADSLVPRIRFQNELLKIDHNLKKQGSFDMKGLASTGFKLYEMKPNVFKAYNDGYKAVDDEPGLSSVKVPLFDRNYTPANDTARDFYSEQALTQLLYQHVPEIYLTLTSSSIIGLRNEVYKDISECVRESFGSDMDNITLTDARVGVKFAWYIAELLLKVAVNMASQSAGGPILTAIHGALGTHGSSIAEINKLMVPVNNSGKNSDKMVSVRAKTGANMAGMSAQDIMDAFLFQEVSDSADKAFDDLDDKMRSTVKTQFKNMFGRLSESVDISKHGKKAKSIRKSASIERLLAPLQILDERLSMVSNLVFCVIDEIKAKYPNTATSAQEQINFVTELHVTLNNLNITGYLSHISHLAKEHIPRISKSKIFKAILAETLLHNKKEVLGGEQILSDGLWKLLKVNDLVDTMKEDSLEPTAIRLGGGDHQLDKKYMTPKKLFGLEKVGNVYHKFATLQPNDKSTKKLVNVIKISGYKGLVTVTTSVGKFGPTSTLGAFLGAKMIVSDEEVAERALNRKIMSESSYRGYLRYVNISEETTTLLQKLQDDGKIELGLRVDKHLI